MRFPRSSGILLHPTCLPGRWGIGDLGQPACQFIDVLVEAGQHLWQILPLNPTGYGDSPYQSFSAFAGNPLLISLDRLVENGLLDKDELTEQPASGLAEDEVNYGPVIDFKRPLLQRSFERLRRGQAPAEQAEAFDRFRAENAAWLNDYALFMALKEYHAGVSWDAWESGIAQRQPRALERWSRRLSEQTMLHQYQQYLFFTQWREIKEYANEHDILIIGDAPIFVAYDSADVWANPDLFYLDEEGHPTVVAGVPPDYFSATGQLWGNPLYRWDHMAQNGYAWWTRRLRMALSTVDILRLDHFRGFEAYWQVPAGEKTAVRGDWIRGPGAAFFQALQDSFGELCIIAEDLGLITPEVEALRDEFHLPGMKILQFAFDGKAINPYLPHNYERNCVVYTGTHDNDTTIGWWKTLGDEERGNVIRYLGKDEPEDSQTIGWDLMRLALMSVADMAVFPLQDILRLGSAARQNTPGRAGGNWCWRFREKDLTPELAQSLRQLATTYRRLPESDKKEPGQHALESQRSLHPPGPSAWGRRVGGEKDSPGH